MTVMIRVRDLVVQYQSGDYVVRPLNRFSLDAHDGELVALLGPSGSGKTTLLSCLAGLLTPTAGHIEVAGVDVAKLSGGAVTEFRRRKVGVVFQAFNLIPGISALDNVATPLRLSGAKAKDAHRRAVELLGQVGLEHRMGHRPGQLSGGQQQRVAIARALALDPPVILADEPTAHLDHVQVESVIGLLRGLAAPGRVVLVATHDDRMSMLADRAVDMAPRSEATDGTGEAKLGDREVLFEQGSRGHIVYEVLQGEIEIARQRADGNEELVAVVGPGDYFGELAPILGLPRSATARARGETIVNGLTVSEFRRSRPSRSTQ
jgi:putative ABC transport system ATP-binding protein